MQKTKKSGYLAWNIDIFIASLKKIRLKDAFLIIILDILFCLLSGYFFLFWLQRINQKMESVYLPFDLASASVDNMQRAAKDAQSFYYVLIFSIVLLVIAVIFLFSALKGIVWAKITSTKITAKLLSKFFLLNVIWLGFWLVVIFLTLLLVQIGSVRIFMLGAIFLSIYLSNISYSVFMQSQSIKSLSKSIKLGFAKMRFILPPFIIMLALFYIALAISNLLKIDYHFLYFVNNMYSYLGFGFSSIAAGSPAMQAGAAVVLLVSLLANPLLLGSFLISRYYLSALVAEVSKSK